LEITSAISSVLFANINMNLFAIVMQLITISTHSLDIAKFQNMNYKMNLHTQYREQAA
jgi:hypothetical protein